MTLPPAQLFPFAATGSDGQLALGSFVLRGWSIIESTGSAAAIANLLDGQDATGPLIAGIQLAQATSSTVVIPGSGVLIRTGVYLDVVSGSVRGTLWMNPITTDDEHSWAHGEYGLTFVRHGI